MYREALLAKARGTDLWRRFKAEHDYFLYEFPAIAKTESVGAVLNKIRVFVRNPFLREMICKLPGSNTYDKHLRGPGSGYWDNHSRELELDYLWGLNMAYSIYLDEYRLGNDGARMLSGMIVRTLKDLMMRKPGNYPVLLVLDELASQERFLGDSLLHIIEKGRQQGLRVLCACQNLGQISPPLRKLLLGSTQFRAFFKMDSEDARAVAHSLTEGLGARTEKVSLDTERERGEIQREAIRYELCDMVSCPLNQAYLEAFGLLGDWERIFRHAHIICDRTLIQVSDVLQGLPSEWYRVDAPTSLNAPYTLVVAFPKVKVSVLQRLSEAERTAGMTKALQELPVGEAFVVADGKSVRVRTPRIEFTPEDETVIWEVHDPVEDAPDMMETRDRGIAETIAQYGSATADRSKGTSAPPKASPPAPTPLTEEEAARAWGEPELGPILPPVPEAAADGSL